MKKPQTSLQEFASSNLRTLETEDLKLIIGAVGAELMCSDSNDSDGGMSNGCSVSSDTDTDVS